MGQAVGQDQAAVGVHGAGNAAAALDDATGAVGGVGGDAAATERDRAGVGGDKSGQCLAGIDGDQAAVVEVGGGEQAADIERAAVGDDIADVAASGHGCADFVGDCAAGDGGLIKIQPDI